MTDKPPSSSRSPWYIGRRGVVHLLQSGLDDVNALLERSLAGNCKEIATISLTECTTADQLEVLVVPTLNGYTCCLHARAMNDTSAERSQSAGSAPIDAAPGSTSQIVTTAQQHLPDFVGIETGDLWLEPLIAANVVTDRALETTSHWSLSETPSPVHTIHSWARKRGQTPIVYQLLIQSGARSGFDVTVRAMQLSERPPIHRRELSIPLANGVDSPFDAILGDELISSRQLASQVWDTVAAKQDGPSAGVHYPSLGSRVPEDDLWPKTAVHSRQSLISYVEMNGLLNATPQTAQYEPFAASPTLSTDQVDLETLLTIFPFLNDTDWDNSDCFASPRLSRTRIVREPTGTDRTGVLPSPSTPDWQSSTAEPYYLSVIRAWMDAFQAAQSARWEAQSKAPHIAGDSSVVDGLVTIVDHEASLTDTAIGSAGGLVAVANQAVATSQQLWVVAADVPSAKWAINVLRQPFQGTDARFGELYTLRDFWVVDGNTIPITDARKQTTWRVTPPNRWSVHVDDEVHARGTFDALAEPELLTLPRLVNTDAGFNLVTADGECRRRYADLSALEEHLLPMRPPSVPRWLTFADRAMVLAVDGTGLRPVRLSPAWQQRFDVSSPTTYPEVAARTFIETHTIPRPDDAPPARDVASWLSRYYRGQADYGLETMRRATWLEDRDYVGSTDPGLVDFHKRELARLLETPVKRTADGTAVLTERSWPFDPDHSHTTN